MTNDSMTCDAFGDRLMAYLEDETDAATRARVERHAVTCVECGAVLADLRKLRIDAANLPELAPSRDLWAGIAARIEAPVVPIGRAGADATPAPRRAWSGGRAALMAASLVAATAVGYLAGYGTTAPVPPAVEVATTPDPVPTIAVDAPGADEGASLSSRSGQRVATATTQSGTTPATGTAPGGVTAIPAAAGAQRIVAALAADYDKEIRQLNLLLESRRNQLDPATVAVIERNLQVIDAAIAESKLAIARDPASRFLIESLNQSLQMKVELMRTAAMLPSRT